MDLQELDSLIRGKNLNFLIGSGASVPLYPSLSFGENYPTFEDVISNSNLNNNAKIFMYLYYFVNWIEPMATSDKDFRNSSVESDVYKNYIRLITWFYNYLQTESNDRPKRINVFTTNYDLIFERGFDEFIFKNPLIYFNDGSRGVFKKYISNKNYYLNVSHSGYNDNYKKEVPTINLFKLHGSISWELENDNILMTEVNSNIQNINEIIDASNLTKEKIKTVIENSKNKNNDKFVENLNMEVDRIINLNDAILSSFYDLYSKLPIINPNKYKFYKTVSEQHYYQLIRSFSYELEKKQAILIIFGFSFADEHIRDIFERSLLNPELQVLLISYSKKDQDKCKELFGGYKNIEFLPKNFDGILGNFDYLLSLLGGLNE